MRAYLACNSGHFGQLHRRARGRFATGTKPGFGRCEMKKLGPRRWKARSQAFIGVLENGKNSKYGSSS